MAKTFTQEQKEIVERVGSLLKVADGIESQIEKTESRVEKLTQSILAKVFRRELV